jgi:hypothetical protein
LKAFVKMSDDSDGAVASEALICEVAGISQSLRQSWIGKYGLRRRPRGTYVEYDVRELAAIRCILEALGPADGSIAWSLVHDQLPDVWEKSPLVLLFDVQDKEATLAWLMSEVAEALPSGHRVLATRLDDAMRRASRAFRRATDSS